MPEQAANGLPDLGGPHQTAIAGAILLVLALAFAPLALWIVRRIAGPREPVRAGWNLAHVGAALAFFVALNFVMYLVVRLGIVDASHATSDGGGATFDPVFALTASIAVMGFTAVFAAGCASQTTSAPAAALGLHFRGFARALAVALVLAPLAYLTLMGLAAVWMVALRGLGIDDVVQPVARMLFDVPREQRLMAAIAGIAVIPFLEELVFRGFLQPALERHVRPFAAIVLTSLAFGAMHGITAIVPIAGLSIVLGYARQRTGSLWAAFALHALNNGFAFYMLWYGPASPAA